MEKSSAKYMKHSARMEAKVNNFLLLHDTLTKGHHKQVHTHPITQLVICKLTILELHSHTNGAFNYEFVEENCEFVLDHLKNNVDPVKSIRLLESIGALGDVKRKDFIILFPALKLYYKKEELKKKSKQDGKLKMLLSTVFPITSFDFVISILLLSCNYFT